MNTKDPSSEFSRRRLGNLSPAHWLLQSEIIQSLFQLRSTLRHMHAKTTLFFISAAFSVLATFINLNILKSVMALSNGLIKNDFAFVRRLPTCSYVISLRPVSFHTSTSLFLLLLVMIYLASILKCTISYSSSLILSRMMALSSSRIRLVVFKRYLSFGKAYLDKTGIGRLHHVLMHFSSEVSAQISAIQNGFKQVLLLVTYLYLMLKISSELTLVLVVMAFAFNTCLKWLVTIVRNTSTEMARAQLELNHKVLNLLNCIPLVKSYAREHYEEERFAEISQRDVAISFDMSKRLQLQPPLEELMIMTTLVAIAGVIGFLSRSSSGFRMGIRSCFSIWSKHPFRPSGLCRLIALQWLAPRGRSKC